MKVAASPIGSYNASEPPATTNVLFFDGHVESRTVAEIDPRLANPLKENWVPSVEAN
jgi:prepilin-type processing-associated H-X9-DG protein